METACDIRKQPHAGLVDVYIGSKAGGTHVLMSEAQAQLHKLFSLG